MDGSWILAGVLLLSGMGGGRDEDPSPALEGLEPAEVVVAVAEAIGRHHPDAPERAPLLRAGLSRLETTAELDLGMLRARLRDGSPREACVAAMREALAASRGVLAGEAARDEVLLGLLGWVPGRGRIVDAEQARIDASLLANRYVGVGIYLSDFEGRPQIVRLFHHGPARRAGIRPNDVVHAIDGVDTLEMDMGDFVEYSRGVEGSTVRMTVAQPGSSEMRSYEMERREVPEESVRGTRRLEDDQWSFRLGETSFAHVRVETLNAGTAHELRAAARRIHDEGLRGVVLDLRGAQGRDPHHAVLCADEFLIEGSIGAQRRAEGVRRDRASEDAAFEGLPVAVLVDAETRGPAEWLASILQARGRAEAFGAVTPGVAAVIGPVEVEGWDDGVLMIQTGVLLDPADDLHEFAPFHPRHRVEGDALRAAVQVWRAPAGARRRDL